MRTKYRKSDDRFLQGVVLTGKLHNYKSNNTGIQEGKTSGITTKRITTLGLPDCLYRITLFQGDDGYSLTMSIRQEVFKHRSGTFARWRTTWIPCRFDDSADALRRKR